MHNPISFTTHFILINWKYVSILIILSDVKHSVFVEVFVFWCLSECQNNHELIYSNDLIGSFMEIQYYYRYLFAFFFSFLSLACFLKQTWHHIYLCKNSMKWSIAEIFISGMVECSHIKIILKLKKNPKKQEDINCTCTGICNYSPNTYQIYIRIGHCLLVFAY